MIKIAKEIYKELRGEWNITYDEAGSVGRRYSRNDESGTPFCITVDEESLKKKTVTIRERDSAEQVKVKIVDLKEIIRKAINGEDLFKLGKKINTRKK